SLAQLLENSVSTPQIREWLSSATTDIHARLVHFSSTDAQSSSHPERSLHCRSSGSNISMASLRSNRPSALSENANTGPPSLHHYSEATPTETSMSGPASHFSGIPFLEEVDGVLERPPNQERTPVWECSFWFLSCSYISCDQEEWKTHCLSHFRGEEPPKSVQCPLCDEFNYEGDNGWKSWNYRQEHVTTHYLLGHTLRTSRPDFRLFRHLWQKRLIDDQDLKELRGGNHHLARPPSNLVVKTGRRGWEGRRQRHQHIGARRTHDTVGQQSTMASHNAVSTTQESEQPILENVALQSITHRGNESMAPQPSETSKTHTTTDFTTSKPAHGIIVAEELPRNSEGAIICDRPECMNTVFAQKSAWK
ncbi:hypothetical protein IQ07DRAFT_501161, partial [Pyrenochaeta sp. DS3sAY3a]